MGIRFNSKYRCQLDVECDSCGETDFAEDVEDFQDGWEQLKKEGWRSMLVNTVWNHHCKDCSRTPVGDC